MVKLKAFDNFENTTDALNAASHLVDSKLPKGLRKFLKAQCQGETLAIADSKLGKAISDKLEINCINNAAVAELMRGLRSQLSELISGLAGQDMAPMSLGLSHSLSRYKLKFSPDKVDTKIVADNVQYAKAVKLMGTADEIPEAPKESPVFVEDLPEKEQGTCHLFTAHSHSTRSQHTLTVVLDHDNVSPFRFVNLKPYALQTLNKNVSLRTVVLDQLPVE
jgi:RNA processing factor Prp31